MKIKHISILIVFIFAFNLIQSPSYAQDLNLKMNTLVKRMKSMYVKSDKAMFNINWLPKVDTDCRTNHSVCKSNIGLKVEKIGKLNCVDLTTLKYAIIKGTTIINAIYSTMTCDLYKVIIETNTDNPKRYYVYNVQYPSAKLEKIAIVFKDGPMMSFKANGQLDSLVYDDNTSCMTQNSKGDLVESSNARTLCRQVIMTGIPVQNYRVAN